MYYRLLFFLLSSCHFWYFSEKVDLATSICMRAAFCEIFFFLTSRKSFSHFSSKTNFLPFFKSFFVASSGSLFLFFVFSLWRGGAGWRAGAAGAARGLAEAAQQLGKPACAFLGGWFFSPPFLIPITYYRSVFSGAQLFSF